MKQFFIRLILLFGLRAFSLIAQTEDPHLLGNVPITFYGKVVDENNQPLQGVQVHVEILVGYLVSPTEGRQRLDQIILATGTDGRFALHNMKGTSIRLNDIEKGGYKLSPKVGKPTYLYYPVKVHPDPEKPEIFRMWRERGAELLIQSGWDHKVSCNGRTNRFDLLRGRQSADGDLEFTCTRTPVQIVPREGKPFDYKFKILVKGGGIQATEDEFTYLAPDTGYTPEFVEEKKADEQGWRGRLIQEFYIKTAEGHYGRITVDWYDWQQNPTHLDWNASINPSGSRNLER